MRFGVSHANIGRFAEPSAAVALVQAVEAAGFESIWTVDHVVLPKHYAKRYPETSDGAFPFRIDLPIAEPLTWIAYAASASETIRMGTGILVLPQRNPLVTAKVLASLDRLTRGRLDVGVGAGWLREEFDALGADFARRGALLDEHIAAMRELWTNSVATHHGETITFREVACSPVPVQQPLPVHIGGFSSAAANRAGQVGEGFFPAGLGDTHRLGDLVAEAREAAASAGREPADLEITARWTRDAEGLRDLSRLDRLAEIGVDRVVLPAWLLDNGDLHGNLTNLATRVIADYC